VATGLAQPPPPARQTASGPATASGAIWPLSPVTGSTRSPPVARRNAQAAAEPGRTRDRPGTAASRTKAVGIPTAGTTQLRCGGCQARARYAQDEPCYGQFVRVFLGQHELCGNAVKITCVRGGQD
jgi:hypothetical protein